MYLFSSSNFTSASRAHCVCFVSSCFLPVVPVYFYLCIYLSRTIISSISETICFAAKVNPLADLGIQLTDVALRNELWGDNKKQTEKKSTSTSGSGMGMGMGKAMGSGSGLGRAGASVLPPAMPPPSMMNVGRGAGGPAMPPPMGMGMAPQMGGMNFNMGMNMGMHPGMGVNPGMGMAPQMGMGMGMGMGMNQGMGMAPNMGMGGYPNQQYNGYR